MKDRHIVTYPVTMCRRRITVCMCIAVNICLDTVCMYGRHGWLATVI